MAIMGRPKLNRFLQCGICRTAFRVRSTWELRKRKYCSPACAAKAPHNNPSGDAHPMWRGGERRIDSSGYVSVWTPVGRMREHIWVMMQHIGRPLAAGEHVHHINHVKDDNRVENLVLLSPEEHGHTHREAGSRRRAYGEENPTISCACGCGGTLAKYDHAGRPRRHLSGHQQKKIPRNSLGRFA